MIVPFPALWGSQRTLQPDHRIDRALYYRTHRLIAAIAYDRSFDRLTGSLSVGVGFGKFLRLKHSVCRSIPISTALRNQCLEIESQRQSDIGIIQPVLADLAAVQAGLVEKLKLDAGKYVDRIMAVSIKEPGIWRTDFDRRRNYTSFCDPTTLAELTGMNVIDAFPARDLLVGGEGSPLDGLPLWLIMAERTPTVSKTDKWLLMVDDPMQLYFLPASDGLDSELPEIQHFSVSVDANQWDREIHQRISQVVTENRMEMLIAGVSESSGDGSANGSSLTFQQIQKRLNLSMPLVDLASLSNYLVRSEVEKRSGEGIVAGNLTSTAELSVNVAAILGFMHIDQMAGNLPWLTGAESQRILGRLTPGRPSQWRQLIRSMADHQPAAMKLKDAV